MSDIDLSPILEDPRRVKRLCRLEKKRRGVRAGSLVFVGMHNIARHWWCTQEAVFKSRENEDGFFAAYLENRLKLAQKRGLIKKLPHGDDTILDAGSGLSFSDAQSNFKKEHRGSSRPTPKRPRSGKLLRVATDTVSDTSDPDESAFERGNRLEAENAEEYPTFRWHFPWKDYVVVGVPDGITQRFVYEYKTTKNRYLLNYVRPVALAQADLYALFFHRRVKRVQIQIIEEGVIETYEQSADAKQAARTLNAFSAVEQGEPARPPKVWKCRHCEFIENCPITLAV